MDERLATLQMRNDEIWDLLEDPDLPPLDRQELNEEMLRNTIEIVILEQDDDDESTISCVSSESIEPDDEYDREFVFIEPCFDLANEI